MFVGKAQHISHRRYKPLVDFTKVHAFLTETFDHVTLNSGLLPQYFEYGHTHRSFNNQLTHHMAVWEDGNIIVGFACYGMYPNEHPGKCLLHVREGYEFLLDELLNWAENEMCEAKENTRMLSVFTTDKERAKKDFLQNRGYVMGETEAIKVFRYEKGFAEIILPAGFKLINGEGIDYEKLNNCFWRSFEGEADPENNFGARMNMCHAPNFRHDLATIIIAPDGEYACALGMWFCSHNKYAYLEPLGTDRKYQGIGLARAALIDAMKKTQKEGALYCFGSHGAFYDAMGFETICHKELWVKIFR